MKSLAAVAALALVAGCFGPRGPPAPPPANLPADWDDGILLHAFATYGAHSGAYQANLNATFSAWPATCGAYRGSVRLEVDTCEVRDPEKWEQPGHNYGDRGVGPWVIEAKWAGCPGGDFEGCHGTPQPGNGPKRVVAFDGGGRAIAWWDGRLSPDTQIATE